MNISKIQETMNSSASSEPLISQRFELARLASEVFDEMASFLIDASYAHHRLSIQGNPQSDRSLFDEL